jgi:hypothetical protein
MERELHTHTRTLPRLQRLAHRSHAIVHLIDGLLVSSSAHQCLVACARRIALTQITLHGLRVPASTRAIVSLDEEVSHTILLLTEVKADKRSHRHSIFFWHQFLVVDTHWILLFVDVTTDQPVTGLNTGIARLDLQLGRDISSLTVIRNKRTVINWRSSIQGLPVEAEHLATHK